MFVKLPPPDSWCVGCCCCQPVSPPPRKTVQRTANRTTTKNTHTHADTLTPAPGIIPGSARARADKSALAHMVCGVRKPRARARRSATSSTFHPHARAPASRPTELTTGALIRNKAKVRRTHACSLTWTKPQKYTNIWGGPQRQQQQHSAAAHAGGFVAIITHGAAVGDFAIVSLGVRSLGNCVHSQFCTPK